MCRRFDRSLLDFLAASCLPLADWFALSATSSLPPLNRANLACCQLDWLQAASDRFDIKVKGKGGHGAAPHSTVDAIVEASHLVLALQTIVSRNRDPLEPAVLSVCMMKGGHGYNIICECRCLQVRCGLSGCFQQLPDACIS